MNEKMKMRFRRGLYLMVSGLLFWSPAGCAPEPTTPAKTVLVGIWISNAHLYTLSNFQMNIVQEPKGIVSGTWLAKGDGGGGGCPEATPCNASGALIGRNTVSQVELELLGAGKFEGGLIEDDKMRGIFAVGLSYDTITFVRTSRVTADRETR